MVADREQHPGDTAGLRQRHESKEESLICEYNKITISVSMLFLVLIHILNLIAPFYTDAMLPIMRDVVCPKKRNLCH